MKLWLCQKYEGYTEDGLKTITTFMESKPNKKLLNNIAYAMYETKR